MKQFVIQDHVIQKILNFIKNEHTHIPVYLRFAYVADKYAEFMLQKDQLEMEPVMLPMSIEEYRLYMEPDTGGKPLSEYKAFTEFNFCLPKSSASQTNFQSLLSSAEKDNLFLTL